MSSCVDLEAFQSDVLDVMPLRMCRCLQNSRNVNVEPDTIQIAWLMQFKCLQSSKLTQQLLQIIVIHISSMDHTPTKSLDGAEKLEFARGRPVVVHLQRRISRDRLERNFPVLLPVAVVDNQCLCLKLWHSGFWHLCRLQSNASAVSTGTQRTSQGAARALICMGQMIHRRAVACYLKVQSFLNLVDI